MYACAMKDVLMKNVPILAIASYNNYALWYDDITNTNICYSSFCLCIAGYNNSVVFSPGLQQKDNIY